jgi:hypothetical protein
MRVASFTSVTFAKIIVAKFTGRTGPGLGPGPGRPVRPRVFCPESGRKLDQKTVLLAACRGVAPRAPQDLVRHVCTTTGLPPGTAERVIADVIAYFGETTEEYVRRRHNELHHRQYRNTQIWPLIAAELTYRPVVAPGLSQRQLRRIVYG